MAKNTGSGSRKGAVRDRFQLHSPITDRYAVFDATDGKMLRVKKSEGPAKGISKRPPKSLG